MCLWHQALVDVVALTQEWEAAESHVEPAIRELYDFVLMYADKITSEGCLGGSVTPASPVIAKFMYLVAVWGHDRVSDPTAFAIHLGIAADVAASFLSLEAGRA